MEQMGQSVPQSQYPDLLGSYIRGAMAPGAIAVNDQPCPVCSRMAASVPSRSIAPAERAAR